jgi:hypothetical protein
LRQPLPVAAELGPLADGSTAVGEGALAELIDEAAAFEDAAHLPVGPRPPPIELSTVE